MTGRKGGLPVISCLVLLLAMTALPGVAAPAETLDLTLRGAIAIALGENLPLMQERLRENAAEAEIMVSEGEFDPVLGLGLSDSYKKNSAPTDIIGTEERSLTTEAGISGKVITGANYELKFTNSRFSNNSPFYTIDPYYMSDLTLTLSQPLLKGAGREVQESSLNVARNGLEFARHGINDKAEQTIADTTKAYWDLLSARTELDVSEVSLRLARDLRGEVQTKISAGLLAPSEIYKAEAEEAVREEALLRNRKAISDAEDNLRVLLNLGDWDVEIRLVEKPPAGREVPDAGDVLKTALEKRKDRRQALTEKKSREILRRYYENQMLPDVSIVGSTGLNGLNGEQSEALDKLGGGRYYSWQIGLSMSMPIGNRTAKGNMLKARYEEDMAELSLRQVEQRITAEARESVRALRLAIETTEATGKTRVAAQRRLDAEKTRFDTGLATLNDVLKFQEEYARALSSESSAAISYAKALIELERVKGTLWGD